MASFLQRAFMGLTGDVKGAFRTRETVKIEKDPNDPEKEILRFGDGKDDYFPVEGTQTDKEALREILSKVIESPTQLKKIRDLPLADRPTLIRDHAKKNCGGYCSGSVISITPLSGTGYGAAGVFCHEFQHQYQFKNGNLNEWQTGKYKTSDKFLNDRIYEAAADTAKYQYMHEIKDKNPQAAHAYAMAMLSPGQRAYSAAKNKGKSEQECMLAGMQGYAKDFYTAHFYAKYYHSEIRETDIKTLNPEYFSENAKSMVGWQYLQGASGMMDGKLDEVAAFKAHTVGMTTETCDDKKVNKALRSAEFNYVTPTVARAITRWAKALKAAGKQPTEDPDKLNVRTAYGVTTNKERGGFAGMMFRAKTKLLSVVNKYKIGRDKDSLGAKKSYRDGGGAVLALTADEKGLPAAQIGFSADGVSKEFEAVKKLGKKEVDKRTETAQKMFGILMKQSAFKRQVDEMHKNGVEINLSFSDAVQQPRTIRGNTILLNPKQKPEKLAEQFLRQFVPVVREGVTAKQADAKSAEKQPEKSPEPQTTASKPQLRVRGEALLKMVDQMTASIADSKKSTTAYQPTDQEARTVDALARLTENAAKGAATPEQATAARAKALGEYAQTAEGMKNVTFLMQSYGRMLSQTPDKLQAHMREQSLMDELNKRQAKNNAARSARTAANAGATAQR